RHLSGTGAGEARAREIAAQAGAAAAALPEPHLALGSVALQVGDHELAARELGRAIVRGPRLAEALAALGRVLVEAGETREGTELLLRALELDPEVPLAASALARATALDGDFARSDALVERMLATESEFSVWVIRARLLMWRRDAARAEVLARELELRADFALVVPLTLLRIVAAGSISPEVAALLVPKDGEGSARRRAFFCQLEAEVTAYVGRPEVALAALGRAVDAGLIDLAWVDRCPLLADLRSSPSFAASRDVVARRAARIVAAARAG
ncbi:MAG: hypothetical protein HY908_00680, partial [Myxococcales bacterium]|nr:hypothetical protein [Myxococcales bacterium]